MPVVGYSHVSIGVKSINRSLVFYRDILGLEVAADDLETFTIGKGQTIFRGEEGRALQRRGIYLRWNDDPHAPFLVLDELLNGEREDRVDLRLDDLGVHHFSFRVRDIDRVVDQAVSLGAEIIREPSSSDTSGFGLPSGGRARSAFLRDPDGNIVQLDEILSMPPL